MGRRTGFFADNGSPLFLNATSEPAMDRYDSEIASAMDFDCLRGFGWLLSVWATMIHLSL